MELDEREVELIMTALDQAADLWSDAAKDLAASDHPDDLEAAKRTATMSDRAVALLEKIRGTRTDETAPTEA